MFIPHIDVWGFCFWCCIRSFLLLLFLPPFSHTHHSTITDHSLTHTLTHITHHTPPSTPLITHTLTLITQSPLTTHSSSHILTLITHSSLTYSHTSSHKHTPPSTPLIITHLLTYTYSVLGIHHSPLTPHHSGAPCVQFAWQARHLAARGVMYALASPGIPWHFFWALQGP